MDADPNEMRAVEIIYERDHGQAIPFAQIPPDDKARALQEIRDRVALIEQHVIQDILIPKMAERRRTPRRHQIGVLLIIAALVSVGFLVAGVIQIFAGKH